MLKPWHYGEVLESAQLSYSDWLAISLAPLVSIGLVNGLTEAERAELVHLARDRRLISIRPDDDEILSQALSRLISDESFLRDREKAFSNLLDSLREPVRQRLSFQLWAAAVLLARYTFEGETRVDDAEKKALTGLAKMLGLGDDKEIRETLGSANRVLSFPLVTAFHRKTQPTGLSPASWASQWKIVQPAAWHDLNTMVEVQDRALSEGKGRLDGVSSLGELEFPETAYVDSGVLVLPRDIGNRNVYFIGDLHGDLESLEETIRVTNLEGSDAHPVLIFLGDYGDRGSDTLGVWLRLAEIKARFPDDIYLLRGNHEDLRQVRCLRVSDGKELSTIWRIPSSENNETFIAMGMAMDNNFSNLAVLFETLPAIVLFPDGTCAVHGGPVPRWKQNDGWTLPADAKEELRVQTVADLRKPKAQFAMRWVDIHDREDVDQAWRHYGGESRLYATAAELKEWEERLGIRRIIHGHTHPPTGFEWACDNRALALNTTRATHGMPAIARWQPGKVEPIPLTVGSDQ